MRIIRRADRRETTMAGAVDIVANGDRDGLRDMVVRLLEELTSDLHGNPVLTDVQLQRVLAYLFIVERI